MNNHDFRIAVFDTKPYDRAFFEEEKGQNACVGNDAKRTTSNPNAMYLDRLIYCSSA